MVSLNCESFLKVFWHTEVQNLDLCLLSLVYKIQDGDRGDGSTGKTLSYANIRPFPTGMGDIKEERK